MQKIKIMLLFIHHHVIPNLCAVIFGEKKKEQTWSYFFGKELHEDDHRFGMR